MIGRLVCFRDPIHAAAAWKAGRRDEVVQTPAAARTRATAASRTSPAPPCGATTSTSPSRPRGRRRRDPLRLRAPARRADRLDALPGPAGHARDGDRPLPARERGGARRSRRVPRRLGLRGRRDAARGGRAGHPGDGARGRLRRADGLPVALGAGRVRRREPERAAVRIVLRSLRDFVARRGTGARVVPWLQDFSLGSLRPAEVARRSAPRTTRASTSGSSGTRRHVHRRRARGDGGVSAPAWARPGPFVASPAGAARQIEGARAAGAAADASTP